MGCLSKMVFLMNILFIIIIDISFWSVGGWELGLIGIVSLIAFIIRWMISDSVDISYRDIFRLSEWGVFMKKISFANGTAFMVWVILCTIGILLGNTNLKLFFDIVD